MLAILIYAEGGTEAEMRQGRNLANAAAEAEVQHFVYSSVSGAERISGVPFLDGKQQTEVHIMSLDLPWTFLRPAHFMENFNIGPRCRAILDGRLVFPLPPDTPLQMVAIDDIGFFAAMVFDSREMMLRNSYEIAGDELTMPEVAQRFSAHIGREVRFMQLPQDELDEMDPEYGLLARWLVDEGYRADISSVREMHPGSFSFDLWPSSGYWWGTRARDKVMEGIRA